MEEAKIFATVLANVGGIGVLAYYLLQLHRDSIRAFREELASERTLYRDTIGVERIERSSQFAELRREKADHHAEVTTRLGRIETDVRIVRELCEDGASAAAKSRIPNP